LGGGGSQGAGTRGIALNGGFLKTPFCEAAEAARRSPADGWDIGPVMSAKSPGALPLPSPGWKKTSRHNQGNAVGLAALVTLPRTSWSRSRND